jgi:hypothetical protein
MFFSETFVSAYKIAWCRNPEKNNMNTHIREKLKFALIWDVFVKINEVLCLLHAM